MEGKVLARFQSGEFYEGQQLCRTFHFRLVGQNKFTETGDLIFATVKALMENDQVNGAVELASLLVESFTDKKVPAASEHIARVVSIADVLPEEQANSVLRAALKWTTKVRPEKNGAPEIQLALAQRSAASKDYSASQLHFARSGVAAVQEFVQFLKEYATRVPVHEHDMLYCRAVLLCLASKQSEAAMALFDNIAALLPSPPTPIVNFTRMLCATVSMPNSMQLYALLRNKYQDELTNDPNLFQILDRVAQVYYNVQPQGQGLLGDLMKSLSEEPDTASAQ